MAIQPVPALLLLALLLSPHSRMEPTETAPTLAPAPAPAPTGPWTPVGNLSAGQPLPGFQFKAAARAPRPTPGPLALRVPLIPLTLCLVLG